MKSVLPVLILYLIIAGCGNRQAAPQSNPDVQRSAAHSPAAAEQAIPSGHASDENAVHFAFGSADYTVKYGKDQDPRFIKAVQTDQGIVWSPSPVVEGDGWLNAKPLTTFAVYLSPLNERDLDMAASKQLFSLPLTVESSVPAGHLYDYLNQLYDTAQWIVYTVDFRNPGMNQNAYCELHAYDMEAGKDRRITMYHNAGGYHFSYGFAAEQLYYEYTTPGAGGDLNTTIVQVDLRSGKAQTLPNSQQVPVELHDT